MDNNKNFIERINSGPIFLFIGQNYYTLDKNQDYFLNKLQEKYQLKNSNLGYDVIFDEGLKSNPQFIDWADQILNNMPDPKWFDVINELPLASIYTSSPNSKFIKSFKNHYRTTSGVYSEKQKIINPRDPHNLHINYLFGCFNQIEPEYKIPVTIFDKSRRKTVATNMFQNISEIITPLGILLIEGYNPITDWFSLENFYSSISNLSNQQTFLFSSTEEIASNEFIQELVKQNKIILINSSLFEYLEILKSNGWINNEIPPYDNFDGHWVNISAKKVKVPAEIYNRVSKSVLLIESIHFDHSLNLTKEEKLILFKDFLANSSPMPKWSGYPLKFAFKREFYSDLKQKCLNALQNNRLNVPFIVHGQASSGKTISLGLLAYELFNETKLPVLFIERKYTKLAENDIDVFYNWAEQNGADRIIIIWDGMTEYSSYTNFLKRLEARGKNILLVGTAYKVAHSNNPTENLIEAPITLSANEKKNFEKYLSEFYPDISIVVKHFNEDNFLAMLYRYLDSSRHIIKDLLNKEVSSTSKSISDELLNSKQKNIFDSNSLAFHLQKAGVIADEDLLAFEKEVNIAGDNITVSNKLLFLVMVPGQFGLQIPFDLLIRAIGVNSFNQDVFRALRKHDILKWYEDSVGNISVSARTTFEAKLIVRSLGGIRAQVDYIKDLIRSLRESDYLGYIDSYESSQDEIQFMAELLYYISPNSDNNSFIEFLYDISLELSNLRETGTVINPRLMLQEASFLRELIKKQVNIQITHEELLEKAELILREALQKISNKKTRLYKYLQVELSSILGAKLKEELNKNKFDKTAAKEYFITTFNQLLDSNLLNANSYRALDVLCWTSTAVIEKDILSESEKLEVEIKLLHLFDLYDSEGVEETHKDEFFARQFEFGEAIGKQSLSSEALKKLDSLGSVAGYYLQAKNILGTISLNNALINEDDLLKVKEAYNFLLKNLDKIKKDGASYYFFFKLWWFQSTKHGLIASERRVLSFDLKDWQRCLTFIEELKPYGENFYTPTIKYLHGICLFHVGLYNDCVDIFKQLNNETDFSLVGKKRIVKNYVAADSTGKSARIFSGEVRYNASLQNNQNKSEIYVPELRISVPFILQDFNQREVHSKQTFNNFFIGFNFRGLIAIPNK